MVENFKEKLSPDSFIDDLIKFNVIYKSLKRNSKLAITIATGIFLLSILYTFLKKPTWQAEFQIVISQDSSLSQKANLMMSNQLGGLSDLLDLNNSRKMQTEFEILQSSSLLRPVFEFYKERKIDEKKSVKNLRYKDWVNKKIAVNLIRRTSVVNFSFKDDDKELLIDVINKISNDYQIYSSKARNRSLKLGIEYLTKQVEQAKLRTNSSLGLAQSYAIENDLTKIPLLDNTKNSPKSGIIKVDIDDQRINAENQIKVIDSKIKQIKEMDFNSSAINSLKTSFVQKLNKLDRDLAYLKTRYTPNDLQIIKAKKDREYLVKLIKEKYIGKLEVEKLKKKSIVEAYKRPKEVILKYKQLLRDSYRDEVFLNGLQAQKRTLELEEARVVDPWELISRPTLLELPISPKKRLVVGLGLIAGFLSAIVASFYKDRRTDLIFNLRELIIYLKYPVLRVVKLETVSEIDNVLRFILSNEKNNFKNISILELGNLDNKIIKFMKDESKMVTQKTMFNRAEKITDILHNDAMILLTSSGGITREKIKEYGQDIKLSNKPVIGIIFVECSI